MADKYLNSNYIKLYPSALRGGTDSTQNDTIYDPESKIGTEYNLTSAINSLTIDGNYVISKSGSELKFSIHGYQFVATLEDSFLNGLGGNSVYASIKLQSLSSGGAYNLLSLVPYSGEDTILDKNSEFIGVNFSGDKKSGTGVYSLHILEKVGGNWKIPSSSLLKIDSKAISIDGLNLDQIIGRKSDAEGNLTVDVTTDHLSVINDASIGELTVEENLVANKITGAKGSIINGVAQKAINIANDEGELRTEGSNVQPVFLDNGIVKAMPGPLATVYGGTGQSNLNNVKVGQSSLSDEATSLVDKNVGNVNTQVYFQNGKPVEGRTIFARTSAPKANEGKDGDVWFQYN